MRRRTSHGHGFWLSYIINMIFRAEWLAAAVVLFILYYYMKLPVFKVLAILSLGVWVIYPLILTLFLGWASRVGSAPEPKKENKNPYSNGGNKTVEKDMMCPCCGKYKLEEIGEYEICSVCGWEDDPVQRKDPDFEGGANEKSLNQAREDFKRNNSQ